MQCLISRFDQSLLVSVGCLSAALNRRLLRRSCSKRQSWPVHPNHIAGKCRYCTVQLGGLGIFKVWGRSVQEHTFSSAITAFMEADAALDMQPSSATVSNGGVLQVWPGKGWAKKSSLCSGRSHVVLWNAHASHLPNRASSASSLQLDVPRCFKIIGELLDAWHHKFTELATICL